MLTFISSAFSQGWKNYPYTPEGSLITFPDDEGRHSGEVIEWWYTAGLVTGNSSGNRYSYMLSYFYFPFYGYDGFRILNLSNDITGQFYTETLAVNYNIMAEDSLNIVAETTVGITESWANKTENNGSMVPFEYVLTAEGVNGAISLEYVSEKPPLILGDGGYFNIGENSYTYYFSLTKNNLIGSLSIDNITEEVSGTAWIDRQYGSFNPLTEEDYEWFYIQLSNDMDLNIYSLFTEERQLPDTSTYKHMSVYVDSLTQYTSHNFEIERLAFHYMPDSIKCYAQEWRLTSPQNNIELYISTQHNNSEVKLPFRFFEGATNVTGTVDGTSVTGQGFAELLHSYEKPQLSITYPTGEKWTSSRAISWNIENPDDGRPLQYNLEYSIDDKATFITIAQELSDPFFYWMDPPILSGSQCWFKIIAYSADSTLSNMVVSSASSVFDPNLTAVNNTTENRNKTSPVIIYPNPAEDILYVSLTESSVYENYRVMDISGRVLMDREITSPRVLQIPVSDLLPGLYFLGLYSREEASLSKFMIQ